MTDPVLVSCRAIWRVYSEDDVPRGWRNRLAFALRRLARRIDGVSWHTVLCDTSEDLSPRDAQQCLVAGLEHGGALWAELAHQRAIDRIMPVAYPELYPEER